MWSYFVFYFLIFYLICLFFAHACTVIVAPVLGITPLCRNLLASIAVFSSDLVNLFYYFFFTLPLAGSHEQCGDGYPSSRFLGFFRLRVFCVYSTRSFCEKGSCHDAYALRAFANFKKSAKCLGPTKCDRYPYWQCDLSLSLYHFVYDLNTYECGPNIYH